MTASEHFIPYEEPPQLCEACGDVAEILESVYMGFGRDPEGRYVRHFQQLCQDCRFSCANCDEWYPNSNMFTAETNSREYCEDCYYELFFRCERCDVEERTRYQHTSDYRDGSFCGECISSIEEEYGEDDYDFGGGRESSVVRSYTTRLGSVFRHWDAEVNECVTTIRGRRDIPYLGFELETNMREGASWSDRENGAIALRDASPQNYLIMKEDGSISGFEIVTEPCDYRTHLEMFPWQMLRTLANDYSMTSWRGAGAGLHVHISKKSFGKLHLGAFLQFHDKNIDELIKLAGRESSYSKFGRTVRGWGADIKMDRVKQALGKEANDDRYVAVNLQNTATVELRYFRGSLKPETVKGVLEFTHSLWLYTKSVKFTSLESHKNILWPAYRSWLFDQPEFTHAHNLVTTRGL